MGFAVGGKTRDEGSMKITVGDDGPAAHAGLKTDDKIVSVAGERIVDWKSLKTAIKSHPGEAVSVDIERDGQPMTLAVTPGEKGAKNEGMILIGPEYRAVTGWGEAATLSLTEPPRVVYELVAALGRVVTGREKPEVSGPLGMVRETAKAVRNGPAEALMLLGMISAYLGGFNLLPVPALDGGRLFFLTFEALAKRKADAKMEAKVHAVGLLMMMALVAVVTWTEIFPKHQ